MTVSWLFFLLGDEKFGKCFFVFDWYNANPCSKLDVLKLWSPCWVPFVSAVTCWCFRYQLSLVVVCYKVNGGFYQWETWWQFLTKVTALLGVRGWSCDAIQKWKCQLVCGLHGNVERREKETWKCTYTIPLSYCQLVIHMHTYTDKGIDK